MASKKPIFLLISVHGDQSFNYDITHPDTGGQVEYVNQLALYIARSGGYPIIVTRDWGQRPSDYPMGIPTLALRDSLSPKFLPKHQLTAPLIADMAAYLRCFVLSTLIRRTDITIVSHYFDSALVAEQARLPFPHYWVPHSLGRLKKKQLYESRAFGTKHAAALEQRCMDEYNLQRVVAGIVATSENLKNELEAGPNLPTLPKIYWAPPGVDPECFYGGRKSKNKLRVVECSRFDPVKRKSLALVLFTKIQECHPDAEFTMTGVPPAFQEEFQTLANALSVRVKFLPCLSRPQYARMLRASHLFVSCSRVEGFGMSICEAMACGCAVVAPGHIPIMSFVPGARGDVPARESALPDAYVRQFKDIVAYGLEAQGRLNAQVVSKFTWERRFNDLLAGPLAPLLPATGLVGKADVDSTTS